MMRMKILFVRHGITKGNREKRYIGSRTDEGLCAEGSSQILEGKKLYLKYLELYSTDDSCTEPSCMVVSSPMKRCLESASIVFEGIEPVIEEDFREIDFGEFENKNYEELAENEHYKEWLMSGGNIDFFGGEKKHDFIDRNLKGFWKLLKIMEHSKKSVAAVFCHGGTIMSILSTILEKPYFDFQVKNGQGYLFEFDIEGEELVNISYNRI